MGAGWRLTPEKDGTVLKILTQDESTLSHEKKGMKAMKHLKRLIVTAVAMLLSLLVVQAAESVPVTNVNEAVPGLGASAVEADTDLPKS